MFTTQPARVGGSREPHPHDGGGGALAVAPSANQDPRLERIRAARLKGYEGDSCGECGNFTLIRNGTCLKCDTCGATSGCS
jgi:ribonucleoside-diphosphate reductase alpha chain